MWLRENRAHCSVWSCAEPIKNSLPNVVPVPHAQPLSGKLLVSLGWESSSHVCTAKGACEMMSTQVKNDSLYLLSMYQVLEMELGNIIERVCTGPFQLMKTDSSACASLIGHWLSTIWKTHWVYYRCIPNTKRWCCRDYLFNRHLLNSEINLYSTVIILVSL